MLAIDNFHPKDKYIIFEEESHTYTINGNSNYKSVTTWIHQYFPSFNARNVIMKMKKGRNWNPSNKYYHMTDREIMDEWSCNGKEAAELGTFMHNNIEDLYNGLDFDDQFLESKEARLFLEYLSENPYRPYRTEWRIYSEEHLLAGSIDMIYHDPFNPGKFIICDWKRCKEIKTENKYEKGFGILNCLDHCNYWHYSLQLNVYKYILENYYDIEIIGMFLVILHPNQEKYIKMNLPDMKPFMEALFTIRLKEVKEVR